jgi:hypothetical protein
VWKRWHTLGFGLVAVAAAMPRSQPFGVLAPDTFGRRAGGFGLARRAARPDRSRTHLAYDWQSVAFEFVGDPANVRRSAPRSCRPQPPQQRVRVAFARLQRTPYYASFVPVERTGPPTGQAVGGGL